MTTRWSGPRSAGTRPSPGRSGRLGRACYAGPAPPSHRAPLALGHARPWDEIEEDPVDLVSVSPDDRVRATFDDDVADAPDQVRQPVSGRLGGKDAVLVALHDQDGDVDPGKVTAEVLQAGGDAADGGPG